MIRRLTQKQIGFSLAVTKEIPPGQAYMTQYKVRTMAAADACASRLLKTAKIQSYLKELRQKAEDATIATVKERKQILTEIARGNLLDYQEVGADGSYLSIDKDSPNSRAISEITSRTEYDKDKSSAAIVTKVKMHNPVPAIDLLNKMEGIGGREGGGDTFNIITKEVIIDAREKLGSAIARLAARIRETEDSS